MQNTIPDEREKEGKRRLSVGLIDTKQVVQFGLYVVIIILGINVPWVRQYMSNASSGNPMVGIGYWVLAALFSLVLVWNLTRNLVAKRKLVRIGLELALMVFWAAWIAWITNDRMNASGAFEGERLGVVFNAIFVGLYFCVLSLVVVWSNKFIEAANNRVNGLRGRLRRN